MPDDAPKFILLHRNKFLTVDAESLEDMADRLKEVADDFAAMVKSGKVFLHGDGHADDYAHLGTDDPDVAEQFGFQEAAELADGEDDPDDDDLDDDDIDTDLYCPDGD